MRKGKEVYKDVMPIYKQLRLLLGKPKNYKYEMEVLKMLDEAHMDLPLKHDHVRCYKFYTTEKLSSTLELELLESKANSFISTQGNLEKKQELEIRIRLLKQYLERLESMITNYQAAFNQLCITYDDKKGLAFISIYFHGKSVQDVANNLNLSSSTVTKWKTSFDKELSSLIL